MNLNTNTESWRALVVDDEPDNLELARDVLALMGADAACARGGEEGLALAASYRPNLVLVDLAMPGLDGWEVQRRLRAQADFNDVPIIALTALAMHHDIARAREAGFDGYITKPFLVKSLLKEIRACIEQFLQTRASTPYSDGG